jgi:hypothetical protein
MFSRISIAAAVALIGFLAASTASDAKTKAKSDDTKVDRSSCLGGGCQGENPDRAKFPQSVGGNYRGKKTKKSSSATSK